MKDILASAVGAIEDLKRIGATEGVHYRISPPGEDITRYPIAFDQGQMVGIMAPGDEMVFTAAHGFAFAIVNPAGMALIGCQLIAGAMRDGKLPPEVAYLAIPDE